jgi:hypothetical protein
MLSSNSRARAVAAVGGNNRALPWCDRTGCAAGDRFRGPHESVSLRNHCFWDNPAADRANQVWVADFHRATMPYSAGEVYVNSLDQGESRIEEAYGISLARLRQLKGQIRSAELFPLQPEHRSVTGMMSSSNAVTARRPVSVNSSSGGDWGLK